MIQTVTEKIQPSQLGICAAHEHLTIDLSRIKKDSDTILDDEAGMRSELDAFFAAGGRAMVEVTNDGMGRNAPLLARLSRESDVKVIASTGFYKDPYLPVFAQNWEAEQFAGHIIQEVRNGIADSGIYPGVIGEIGSSHHELKPIEKELLKGAGLAGIQTGLPVTTHTTLGTLGLEQVEIFSKMGLAMDQLVIGHQDLNPNREEVLEIVKAGAFVGFDTIGKTNYRSDEERLDLLLYLWEKGHGPQILLSADLTRKSHWKKHGGPGYGFVLTSFVPRLKEAGLTDTNIEQLLIRNPATAFCIKEDRP
ncbi:phosphotriesterase [Salicibibacter halophilus]|uniref:Phosphotriesterase n=1 Tax=Salicibibacter halophilus TaxID=2502791 RepID=A0A514LEW2_9BACI|nr:phosphotriesterase [Salicibibacter halophilus]QDI90398.1 phosphotriesterase [Salicibibacter halophilus]